MGPVKVAEEKKQDDKNKKKGLLASLLSLFGRGAASSAPGVIGTATVATTGSAAGAGLMGMLLSKNGLVALLVGGGAIAAGVGIVGTSFLGAPPSSTGIKDGQFSNHARAVRNVDDDEAPNHLQMFNEGVTLANENGGAANKKDATAGGTSTGSGSSGASAYASAGASASGQLDAYGNRMGAMKSSFGDAAVGGAGGSGGSGGSGSSGAVGRGSDATQGLQRTGGSGGKLSGMRNAAQAVGPGGKKIALGAGAKGARRQAQAAAAMSQQARNSGNYQASGAIAGKAFAGGTTGGGTKATIGGGIGTGGAGIGNGTIAPPVNPDTVLKDIKQPDVAAPKKVEKNSGCKQENIDQMDPSKGGPMNADEFGILKKDCDNKKKLDDQVTTLAILGLAVAALAAIGKLFAQSTNPQTKAIYGFIASAMLAVIMIKCALIMAEASKIMGDSPSLKSQATGQMVMAGMIIIAAGIALYGTLKQAISDQQIANKGAAVEGGPANAKTGNVVGPDGKVVATKDAATGKMMAVDSNGAQIKGADGKPVEWKDPNIDTRKEIPKLDEKNNPIVDKDNKPVMQENERYGKPLQDAGHKDLPLSHEQTKIQAAEGTYKDELAKADGSAASKARLEAARTNYDGMANDQAKLDKGFRDQLLSAQKGGTVDDGIRGYESDMNASGKTTDPGPLGMPTLDNAKATFNSGLSSATDRNQAALADEIKTRGGVIEVHGSTEGVSKPEVYNKTLEAYNADAKGYKSFDDYAKNASTPEAKAFQDQNGRDVAAGKSWTLERQAATDTARAQELGGAKIGALSDDPGFRDTGTRQPVTTATTNTVTVSSDGSTTEVGRHITAAEAHVAPENSPLSEDKTVVKGSSADSVENVKGGGQATHAKMSGSEPSPDAKGDGSVNDTRTETTPQKPKSVLDEVVKPKETPKSLSDTVQEAGDKAKEQAQSAVSKMQEKSADGAGAAKGADDSVSKGDLKKALQDQAKSSQATNVAKAASKTGDKIADAAKGIGKEFGTAAPSADPNAPPSTPGLTPGQNGPAATPGPKVVEGPGSVEEEMKKLFG